MAAKSKTSKTTNKPEATTTEIPPQSTPQMPPKSNFTVGFIGEPSAGKSSACNALCLTRLAPTGVARTTTEIKEYEVESDDGFKFKLIDMPGLADGADEYKKFDKIAYETAQKCDLVLWVTDANTSFLTKHEVDEFEKLKKHIDDLALNEGIAVQLAILVTKFDRPADLAKPAPKPATKRAAAASAELSDDEAETTINDLYRNLVTRYPAIKIMPFNAFGRSYHHPGTSDKLKKHVSNSVIPSKFNIEFKISEFVKNVDSFKCNVWVSNLITTSYEKMLLTPLYSNTTTMALSAGFGFACGHYGVQFQICCGNYSNLYTNSWNQPIIRMEKNGKQYEIPKKIDKLTYFFTHGFTFYTNTNYTIAPHGNNYTIAWSNAVHTILKPMIDKWAKMFIDRYKSLSKDSGKLTLLKYLICADVFANNELVFAINRAGGLALIDSFESIALEDEDFMPISQKIYRLLTLANNLGLSERLRLYNKLKETVYLGDGYQFRAGPLFGNIKNIYQLISRPTKDDEFKSLNAKMGTAIYSRSFMDEIKKIRKSVNGAAEDDVPAEALFAAYGEYGLFWTV
jgi:GTP-binding protein EngB required for normal cell division